MEKLFEDDEVVRAFHPNWSAEHLLAQNGLFALKDIARCLAIHSPLVKMRARRIRDSGRCPYAVMGCRKIWTHWFVRMKVFAPYYLKHLKAK